MYKQRARELAVNLGDSNTKYLYQLMKKRQSQAFISQITYADDTVYTDSTGIAVVFISHFQNILGPEVPSQYPDLSHITPHGVLTKGDALDLMRPVSVGVLWDDADHPIEGAIHSAMDYYQGILRFVDLIPAHLSSILIEADYSLAQLLRLP
ncbi:hypothetical protein MRB53_030557 [Persea americana]|uniref:Uncharacterized protein n=1 Tax=Persea americana TaxID=3435 RepID=A0ACC2KLN1_PERAE|nr:hypothetical protein MRB53_030557 [Persea americana]